MRKRSSGIGGGSELCNPAQAAIVRFEMVPQHSDHAETPDEYWLAERESDVERWFDFDAENKQIN